MMFLPLLYLYVWESFLMWRELNQQFIARLLVTTVMTSSQPLWSPTIKGFTPWTRTRSVNTLLFPH